MPDSEIVHVIDDDDAMRESLAFLFKSVKIAVKSYEDASSFLAVPEQIVSGCVVTDVRMPGVNGIELLKRLREKGNFIPVIVITGHGDVPLAVEAMKAGAANFIEKPFDVEVLLASVRAALSKQASQQEHASMRGAVLKKLAQLSPREREVLNGLVAGHPNKIIAFDLGISPRTIEIYRANVMDKMEAASLAELVRMALVAGVLDEPLPANKTKTP